MDRHETSSSVQLGPTSYYLLQQNHLKELELKSNAFDRNESTWSNRVLMFPSESAENAGDSEIVDVMPSHVSVVRVCDACFFNDAIFCSMFFNF